MSSLRSIKCLVVASLVWLSIVVIAEGSGQVWGSQADWVTYHNAKYSITFRYPPNLEAKEFDTRSVGLPTLRLHVLLIDKADPNLHVVSLMVNESMNDPMTSVPDKSFLKKVCKKYKERRYNGYDVIRCVTCGRGACAWTIYHMGKFVYSWHSGINETGYDDDPTDSKKYPVLTIIKSTKYNGHR